MARILVVEDSLDVQKTLEASLRDHSINSVDSLKGAESALQQGPYDLIVLDVSLPDGDGFELCSKFKLADNDDVPVVFLSGRSETQDKVLGFSLGAEDYVTKPFDPVELKARIEARLKKRSERIARRNIVTVGDLVLDVPTQQVTWKREGQAEEKLQLTPLEFKLLLHFARHLGQVLKRDQLLEAIWGNSIYITDRTIDSHVSHLRKKISRSSCFIFPVYGVGYRLAISDSMESMN